MKSRLLLFVVVVGIFGLLGQAQATVVSFKPNPADLGGLDHGNYYQWGVQWTQPANTQITGAKLYIDNINNWTYEPNQNWLYIHLLDNPAVGVVTKQDGEQGGDNFAGQGKWVATYTDNSTQPANLVYDFSDLGLLDALKLYAADGKFGFGFDPDCHYYNDGIRFEITTGPARGDMIPEPSTLMLGMVGMGGLALGWRRRRLPFASC